MKLIVSVMMGAMLAQEADLNALADSCILKKEYLDGYAKCATDNAGADNACAFLGCNAGVDKKHCTADEIKVSKAACIELAKLVDGCAATVCDFASPLSVAMVFFGLFVRW